MSKKPASPAPSKAESKAEQTHTVVMEILDRERDVREAKTKALKAQRIARDEAAATEAAKPEKPVKKRATKNKKT